MSEDLLVPMRYRTHDGLKVCFHGSVVIDSIEHLVIGGYVSCNKSLNGSAWNISEKTSVCPKCFPTTAYQQTIIEFELIDGNEWGE